MILQKDTTLYHPIAGKQVFPKGEQHPGAAWFDNPECVTPEPVKDPTVGELLTRLDLAERTIERLQHDIAVHAGAREAAEAQIDGLKREAAEAERRAETAEAAAREATDAQARNVAHIALLESKLGTRTAEPPSMRDDVEIPADWRELKWFALRSLAAKLTNDPVNDKADAVAAIEAELARRG